MAVVQLAEEHDVAEALGRDLIPSETARVGAILDKASELFRLRSGQVFTPASSLVRLKVNGGRVYLPQRPVTEVLSVTDDREVPVAYTRFKQWLTTCRASHEFVIVNYKHGGDVPDVVRLAIAEIAKKVLTISAHAAAGLVSRSEGDGPFSESETYATWAQGGQTMLAPDDLALAESFRVRVPGVIVMVP